MKKIYLLILTIFFLNGCAQTTSMMGPTYTLVKTGSVLQAGSSMATSYGIKSTLGQSPSGYIFSFAMKKSKIRECQTFHTSNLNEIFFDTLDEIDCLRNPFSILK